MRKTYVYEGRLKPLKEVPDKWKKIAEEISLVYKDCPPLSRWILEGNKLVEKK